MRMNKITFAVGLVLAIVVALMMYCQEDRFIGVDLEFWPMVLGIPGIRLIATSGMTALSHSQEETPIDAQEGLERHV
jgi:hypothetical protein